MEENVQSARQKVSSLALFFFAFVGFVAALVQIASFFQSSSSGALRVEITPNDFQVPLEVAEPLADDSATRKLVDDLKEVVCSPPKREASAPAAKTSATTSDCEDFGHLESAARWANAFAATPGTMYRYDIENRGSGIAQKIRIAANDVASLQVQRGTKFVDIQPDKNEAFYVLPDLNPHEKATVLIWMISAASPAIDYSDAPAVTFAGATVHREIMRQVPERWWSVYDEFGDIPTFLLLALIVGLAFAITLGVVFVISLIVTVASGKPIKSMFETDTKKQA